MRKTKKLVLSKVTVANLHLQVRTGVRTGSLNVLCNTNRLTMICPAR